MALRGHPLSDVKGVAHILANLHDFTGKLVADHDGGVDASLSPFVPVGDVKVGAANPRVTDANQHIDEAAGGLGNVCQSQAGGPLEFLNSTHEPLAGRLFEVVLEYNRRTRNGIECEEKGDFPHRREEQTFYVEAEVWIGFWGVHVTTGTLTGTTLGARSRVGARDFCAFLSFGVGKCQALIVVLCW
jgi:hypothetical protein